ncbi:hypothetical protein BgiMline_018836, partial [Biomphalaria glabrata]
MEKRCLALTEWLVFNELFAFCLKCLSLTKKRDLFENAMRQQSQTEERLLRLE